MKADFEALSDKRKQVLKLLDDNDYSAGIMRLLTDIYPDTAHFVYELLQNAEDALATQVEFGLSPEGVYFAHDGKRAFTIDDVAAITGIGSNASKKANETAIGEFGVGFKAVFAYTDTPEIHSGEFHFCIHDFLVPDTTGVQQRFLKRSPEEGWTEFYFPFNNPNKPAARAYEETLRGLEKLNETSLLFLSGIRKIAYSYSGMRAGKGLVERDDLGNGFVSIRRTDGSSKGSRTSEYLRFTQQVKITSDRGKRKYLPVSIAYAVVENQRSQRRIVPIEQAGTFVYFPAEKEKSNLRFHINAPFSATVARDSIRDCDDNRMLMAEIATLVAHSLGEIKRMEMLDVDCYAVFPNNWDILNPMFEPIRATVYKEFRDNPYLVTKTGGFVRSDAALIGPRVLSDVLSDGVLEGFARTTKTWVANPNLKSTSSREWLFLQSLDIEAFDECSFAKCFGVSNQRSFLIDRAHDSGDAWLKLLYMAMSSITQAYVRGDKSEDEVTHRERSRALSTFFDFAKKAPLVKCFNNRFAVPEECFFLPRDMSKEGIPELLVDSQFIEDASKTTRYAPAQVRECFAKLGVREYSMRVELDRLMDKYSKQVNIKDKTYYKDLATIARAHKQGIDVDLQDKKLFVVELPNGKMALSKAADLVIGAEYGNPIGNEVAEFSGLGRLSPLFTKVFSSKKQGFLESDCTDFVALLMFHGARKTFRIEESPISANPYYSEMVASWKRSGAKAVSCDYAIKGIERGLEAMSDDLAFELWQILSKNGTTTKYARSFIQRTKTVERDSLLIACLKKAAWLPDAERVRHRPGEITFQQLESRYQAAGDGELIRALDLGSDVSERKLAERRLESEAEKQGKRLISEEDFALFQEFKERQRKRAERDAANEEGLSAAGLFERQDKTGRSNLIGTVVRTGAVGNPSKRAANIAGTIRDSQELPVKQRTSFARVYESSKEERESLRRWYGGYCQICGDAIVKADGTAYFEAINIIDTSELPGRLRNSLKLAWNSLCLCPNCAAKYRYSAKKISMLLKQVLDTEVLAGDDERIALKIELAGRTETVSFAPKHFVALQQGIRMLDE